MANGEKGKGRSQNQRLKLFYLLDYLLEQTDETHTVKVQEIIDHFDNYHKIPIEQKTVCSDLHLLDEYGYETQYDGRTRGWRIVEREFETQELQLLIDSVQSSRFITQKQKVYYKKGGKYTASPTLCYGAKTTITCWHTKAGK